MIMHHYLKCDKEYFEAVGEGIKKFELRKNDRDFKVGDMVHLEEVKNDGVKTGRRYPPFKIKYILQFEEDKYGLIKGFCILNW